MPLTNQIFAYCLVVAAERTGVRVHAACVLSNHWHVVVSDPHGQLPVFTGFLHKFVSKAVNASLGRWENLWASEQPSQLRLVGPEDVIARMIYTLANPVAAKLALQGRRPGLTSPVQMPPSMLRAPGLGCHILLLPVSHDQPRCGLWASTSCGKDIKCDLKPITITTKEAAS